MLSQPWKVRGLVCRGIVSSWCLMETISVLSLLVILVILALLITKSAWAFCPFGMSDSWLHGSTVCGHLSKRRLSNRVAACMACDLDFDWLKQELPDRATFTMGYAFCFCLGLADLLLPVSYLVCILITAALTVLVLISGKALQKENCSISNRNTWKFL